MPDDDAGKIPSCPDLETWCAYVDGSLTAAAARQSLTAHLAACDRCAARVATLRRDLAGPGGQAAATRTPAGLLDRARGGRGRGAAVPPRTWWRLAAAAAVAAVVAGAWWAHLRSGPPAAAGRYALVEAPGHDQPMGFAATARPLASEGPVQALVVFTSFAGGAPHPLPEGAADLLRPDLRGSVSHYFEAMSCGRLRLGGGVLPHRYAARHVAALYRAGAGSQWGRYDQYLREVLEQVDDDVDLARFDGDGPDGVADSGDDDGVVDYVFLVLEEVPEGFIAGPANALIGLGLARPWASDDLGRDGEPVIVSGAPRHGAILPEGSAADMADAMCHLFGHSLGLSHPEVAGTAPAGRWDLMGPGPEDGAGPAMLGAGHREHLGWLDAAAAPLVTVTGAATDLRLADPQAGGPTVRIPLAPGPPAGVGPQEYLLVEARFRSSQAYSRSDGLFIWRVEWTPGTDPGRGERHLELLCAPPDECEGTAPQITNIRRQGEAMVIDVEPQ